MIIAVAPRLYMTLMHGEKKLPLGNAVWKNTTVNLPKDMLGWQIENIYLGGPKNNADVVGESQQIQVGHLLQSWPVALLKGTVQ